ncbi:MAG TPA: septum formation initiator family protein [Bauldia sp.]|nr:septum formation initiator family protein [Bauldia sp.]
MITRHRKKSVLRRLLMPVVAVGFLSYFGYHAFNGAFGIWAMDRLEADAAQLTIQRDKLVAQRTSLEHDVASVRPSSLDADVVDLRARHALNVMRPDELLINLGAAQQ